MHEKFKFDKKKNFLTLRIIQHEKALPPETVTSCSESQWTSKAALCLKWFSYGSKWKWTLRESGGPGDLSQSLLVSKFHYSVILLKRKNTCNNVYSFRGQSLWKPQKLIYCLKPKRGREKKEGSSQAWRNINYCTQTITSILLKR